MSETDENRGMDLATFLLARIAEDEAVARAASPGPWTVDSEVYAEAIHGPDGADLVAGGRWGDEASVFDSTDDALHIARWDPARVLAECAAKRRIVEEHGTIAAAYPGTTIESDPCCATCSAGGEYPGEFPCPTLRLLALPYADHPDYRDEWRP